MNTYYLNNIDITGLIHSRVTLSKRVGRGTSLATNNVSLNVINDDYIFSPEREDSLLYEFREDYSKIPVEIKEDTVTKWKGVVDNILRKEDGTLIVNCVESIIKILSPEDFIYYDGDGYVGDLAYAGDTATPAEHQLAVLRRFIDEENINVGSFKVLKEFWENASVTSACEVIRETKITPLKFVQDLLLDSGYISIKDNKILVKYYDDFLGDYGATIPRDYILDYSIDKEKYSTPYYSYSITYDNSGTPDIIESSSGDSGTSTSISSTTLTDDNTGAGDWEINRWKDKFVFIGDPGDKEILKITGNNKNQLFFSGCTKTGIENYTIVESSKIYYADYSDFPIKVFSGAGAIGTKVISKSTQSKLKIVIKVLDYMGIEEGDTINLTLSNEGVTFQPFEVVELRRELNSEEVSLTCIDKVMYPILADYQIEALNKPSSLTGYRLEGDGSVYLSWTAVSGASYYIVTYGTNSPVHSFQTNDNTNVHITENLEKWLGYYFWVVAVNFIGLESEKSDSLFLDKLTQSSGYIDGSLGYLYENFENWGYLEEYFYNITYKNISYNDIGFLLKSAFVVLDKSQSNFVEEIAQVYEDNQASLNWGAKYRRAGYVDGAGTSTYLPEFLDDSVYKIKNPLSKKLVLNLGGTPTVISPGAEIPGSEDWFIFNKDGGYCTYWFATGIMMDLNNDDQKEWFRVFKINQAMGIWENGVGNIVVNSTTKVGTLIDTDKTWILNQWDDYYIGIVNSTMPLDIEWYKILNNAELDSNTSCDSVSTVQLIDTSKSWNVDEHVGNYVRINNSLPLLITSNTSNTLYFTGNTLIGTYGYEIVDQNPGSTFSFSFDFGDDALLNQKYIINNEPYIGFHGLIIDDVWTSIYSEEVNLSNSDSNTTSDSASATSLVDSSKSWTVDEWEGYYVSVDGGSLVEITSNTSDTLNFSGNAETGSSLPYIIYERYYYDTGGKYYWEVMAEFIEFIIENVENNSYALFDNWDKCEEGLVIINTWPDKWEAYPYFVAAVNKRYRHFLMFEALQCTWSMANEVTKQFIVLDWHEVVDRWDLMKISAGVGYARLAILGYPPHQQMFISHIVGSLLMSRYSDRIEDITAAGNIVLDQLYYDMLMAGNIENMKTVGNPSSGFEESYTQSQYDRYGIILRKFEGAYLFYNPSRQIRSIDYTFDEDVVDYHTGYVYEYSVTYTLLFAPRSASVYFKSTGVGEDAYNFLTTYEPYSYFDYNACWIIFTSAGKSAIGTDSVWIENGHSNHNRFVLDGSQTIPEGVKDHLFHAGDGAWTYVTGHNPEMEVLLGTGVDTSIEMTSQTILGIVDIIAGGSTWVVEDSGTDVDGYAGADWLEDYTKSWTTDEWVGYYVSIEGQTPILITGNSASELYFSGNPHPEGNVNYEIGYTDILHQTTLIPNVDYLVEKKEWDATASGKGKWKTYIYLLTDQTGLDLTTYYYQQGIGGDGYPEIIYGGEQVEHGILYRGNSGFALKTGAINEADCTTYLVEGVDYYIFPEGIRWKWDYRISPFGTFTEDKTFSPTINLNIIYSIGGNDKLRALQWGIVDPENAILINADEETDYSINGKKATYTSCSVVRPKVLIYGFSKVIRDGSLNPVAPASRQDDVFLFENSIKKFEGIYYDEVVITGDWDGVIETGSVLGAYGSIQGMLNDTNSGFATWQEIADYFDVILINDTFLEYTSGSITGCAQWSSWLKQEDYDLLKGFKKRANTAERNVTIFDRRSGAPAFVWYGGTEPVHNSLLNKGTALVGSTIVYSDLTDVFGVYTYGGVSLNDLSDASASIYVETIAESFIKLPSSYVTDFRIGKIVKEINHYSFDESEGKYHPPYNVWENGGDYISYIPKTKKGRTYFNSSDIMSEESKMFLLWKDLTSLIAGEENFYKYEEINLDNIPLRREPLLIYHYYNFFNVVRGPWVKTIGEQSTEKNVADYPYFLGDTGQYRGCMIIKPTSSEESFLVGKTLYLHESEDDDFKQQFNLPANAWGGYIGHYISDVDKTVIVEDWGGQPVNHVDYGWLNYDRDYLGYTPFWGYWFGGGYGVGTETYPAPVDWGNVIEFDTWDDSAQTTYSLSKASSGKGCMPFRRYVTILEGDVQQIVDNGDDTITVHCGFDVSNIDPGTPLASGYITKVSSIFMGISIVEITTNIDLRPYDGDYIHIETNVGVRVFKIDVTSSKSCWFFWSSKWGDWEHLKNDNFDIREGTKTYKVAIVRTDSENNIVFNCRILEKNDSLDTLKLYLPRGESQSGSGGYIMAYQAEEDTEITVDDISKTNISNRDVFGGRIAGTVDKTGADIFSTYIPQNEVHVNIPRSTLENLPIREKPASIIHYEWVYGSLIKEFGYEYNTGLVTCQCFYAHGATNRPPVFIFPGVSENDFHQIINKQIGTKLNFTDLQVSAGDTLYLYYNSFNDMLQIKTENIENPIDGFYKFGDLKSSDQTLLKASVKNIKE